MKRPLLVSLCLVFATAATMPVAQAAEKRAVESKPDVGPLPRFQARPAYPFEMRRAGIAGEVVVGFIITTDGDVEGAHAVRSSRKEFEKSAVECVQKWKFKPATKNGKPVAVEMMVPIVFSLN